MISLSYLYAVCNVFILQCYIQTLMTCEQQTWHCIWLKRCKYQVWKGSRVFCWLTNSRLWSLSKAMSLSSCLVCSLSWRLWAEISFWACSRSSTVKAFTPSWLKKKSCYALARGTPGTTWCCLHSLGYIQLFLDFNVKGLWIAFHHMWTQAQQTFNNTAQHRLTASKTPIFKLTNNHEYIYSQIVHVSSFTQGSSQT